MTITARTISLSFLLLAVACQRGSAPPSADEPIRGGEVNPPVPKVDFTLADTDGAPFDFRDETDGYVTLLFFGYTNCPDVCPLHMSRIGSALNQIDPEYVDRIKVVFVSVDPERDTPERIRNWLDNFHPSFIGLRGSRDAVNEVISRFRFPMSRVEQTPEGYGVAHPGVVIAFTPDNVGRFLYLSGSSTEDWVHDLPILATRTWSD